MTRFIVTTCLLLLITISGMAQKGASPYKHRSVGLSLGWQNFKVHDQHASPLAYTTNSIFPSVGLFFGRQTAYSDFNIRVSGAVGQANATRFGARNYKAKWSTTDSFQYQVSSKFINANIEASYMRNLTSLATEKTQYWVGGTLTESAYYADEMANLPWMFNTLDVAPVFQMIYTLNSKHNIGIRVDLSAIGLVTRQVYALFPKSNKDKNVPAYLKQGTRVASLDKLRKANLQLTYRYQVAKHFAVGAQYRMRWIRYNQMKPIHAMDRHFDISFAYTY